MSESHADSLNSPCKDVEITHGLYTFDEARDDDPHIEHVYGSFICPLTKEVMQDPVTLENGLTFERKAIEDWLKQCARSGRKPATCPLTSRELQSTLVYPNVALKDIIGEWVFRNELAQLKLFSASISPECPESRIMNGLKYVEYLYMKGQMHKEIVCDVEVIRMVTGFLTNPSRDVRCQALRTLNLLAEMDENKEAMCDAQTVHTVVKFLSQDHPQERADSVALLHELSKSKSLSEMIGKEKGAVLILIGIAGSITENNSTCQETERILENLEVCEENVKQMAENGRMEPLLRMLLEGSPKTQCAMAAALGNLNLSDKMKLDAAQSTGPTLLRMIRSDDIEGKEMALRALSAISSCESSAKLLMRIGALPTLIEELFSDESRPPAIKAYSAVSLAKLIASSADFKSIAVEEGLSRALVSEETIDKLLQLTNATNITVRLNVLCILVSLTSSHTTVEHVVAGIKRLSTTTIKLLQFKIEDQTMPQLRFENIKFLHNILPFMRKELAIVLSSSGGLTKLIRIALECEEVQEEHASAIGVLAELPDEPKLIQRLVQEKAFDSLIAKLRYTQQGKTWSNRHYATYFERLVRVIAKVTYVLECDPVMEFALKNEIAVVFADLLQLNGRENVLMVSAKALRNLSLYTVHQSQVPKGKNTGWQSFRSTKKSPCKVHHAKCSLRKTFCLTEGETLKRLVSCLDHANEKVVEAALGALCTMLVDEVDIEAGTLALDEAKGVGPISNILASKCVQSLHQHAIWVVERLLRTQGIALQINVDLKVRAALVEAFRNGDSYTREIADAALKLLDVLPVHSMISRN